MIALRGPAVLGDHAQNSYSPEAQKCFLELVENSRFTHSLLITCRTWPCQGSLLGVAQHTTITVRIGSLRGKSKSVQVPN